MQMFCKETTEIRTTKYLVSISENLKWGGGDFLNSEEN